MDTPETATVEVTQADRKRLAAFYRHPLVNNPSMAEAVLADDWLSGASDAEIAMLETLARHRTRATRQDGLRESPCAICGRGLTAQLGSSLQSKADSAAGWMRRAAAAEVAVIEAREALQKISTGKIDGEPNNARDTLSVVRQIATDALAALSDSSTREESGAALDQLQHLGQAYDAGDALREAGWSYVAVLPMWSVAVVTDGERVAIAQKAEADFDGYYWAIEPEDALDWEPTHCIALPAALSASPEGEGK